MWSDEGFDGTVLISLAMVKITMYLVEDLVVLTMWIVINTSRGLVYCVDQSINVSNLMFK